MTQQQRILKGGGLSVGTTRLEKLETTESKRKFKKIQTKKGEITPEERR